MLTLANASSLVDRQAVALLVTPIKRDLSLTDSQIGWLLGLSFALFFSVFGLPLGRLADLKSRRAIIGWGVATWSVMCSFCGIAQTYWQLFLARMGLGIGEASLTPAAYSLVADLFPPRRLAVAMSVFGVGTFLGSGLGYLVGGTLIEAFERVGPMHVPLLGTLRPWQLVFLTIGLPGLPIALLLRTVREPQRVRSVGMGAAAFPVRCTFAHLRAHLRAFGCHGVGFAIFALVNLGTAFWFPAFFERVHGWSRATTGLYMGGATVIFGTLGILAGGRTAAWMKKRGGESANIDVGIIASLIAAAAAIPLYLTTSFSILIAGLIVTNIAAAFPWGAAAAALQEMTPASMRGQTSAVFLFLINVLGGLGPPVVGLVTDRVFRDEAMIAMSLLTVTLVGRLLSALFLASGRSAFRETVRGASSTL